MLLTDAKVLRLSSVDMNRPSVYKFSSFRRHRLVAEASPAVGDDREAEKNSDGRVQRHAVQHSDSQPDALVHKPQRTAGPKVALRVLLELPTAAVGRTQVQRQGADARCR